MFKTLSPSAQQDRTGTHEPIWRNRMRDIAAFSVIIASLGLSCIL